MQTPNRILSAACRRTRRGMAMVGMMLVLFGILTAALLGIVASTNGAAHSSGLMANTDNALQMSGRRGQSTAAFNMAESGMEYTLQWLHSLSAPPSATTAFTPAYQWQSTAAGTLRSPFTPDPTRPTNTFQVVLYPDVNNSVASGQVTGTPDKAFLIESVGRSGGSTEILQAYVKTTSLSKYLVLVNNWASNNYWVSGLSTFDGPVHDNNFKDPPDTDSSGNPLSDGQLENVAWYDASGSKAMGWTDANGNAVPHPLFTYTGSDAYESSGPNPPNSGSPGVNWYRNNNFGTTSAPTGTDWQYVAAGGQSTVSYGAPPVPFPSSSDSQQLAAEGLAPGTTPLTPVHGVTAVPGGGITIGGNVDQMTLSVDPTDSTKQVIEVYQKDATTGNEDYTKITIAQNGTTSQQTGTAPAGKLTASQVTLNPSSSWPTSVSTASNGVVYVDGNVGAQGDPKSGGLSGMVADNSVNGSGTVTHQAALTIATNANDSLNIDGGITYHTARQKDANGNYVSEASDPNFVKKAGTLGVVSNNILITENQADGTAIGNIETDGTFLAHGVFDVDHYANRPTHNWENMGGYLSNQVGIFGVFNNSTGQIVNGMNNQFNYDARMRDNPPPFFPTNGNMYDVLSWHRTNQTLDGTISAS
jgi:hypothetical protein